ncbi:MAG: hypothetical protein EBZ48_01050 [Proteobacteria bacterium]|nr:hypothetical protein [Pseudomonadota bacterium]
MSVPRSQKEAVLDWCYLRLLLAATVLCALVLAPFLGASAAPKNPEAKPKKSTKQQTSKQKAPKGQPLARRAKPVLAQNAVAPAPERNADTIATQESTDPAGNLLGLDQNRKDLPTYIKAEQLTVNNKERIFSYSGGVEVTQGDLVLTAQTLDGSYDEKNQIKELVARQNVVIVKGEGIHASGERAVYDRASEILLLTDNPELNQGGSILTADRIRIFLKENRSIAEGQVRVKVVRDDKKGSGAPLSLQSLKR